MRREHDSRSPIAPALALAAVIAVLGWLALAVQFPITTSRGLARGLPLATAALNFFGFFTILTNLIAAVTFTLVALDGRKGLPVPGPEWRGGVSVWMAAMCGIFFALLAGQHTVQGLSWAVDRTLHLVLPVLVLAHWLLCARRDKPVPWHMPLVWLVWPIGYTALTLVRGLLTGNYVYPFLDVGELGFAGVGIRILVLGGAFAALGFLVIGAQRLAAHLAGHGATGSTRPISSSTGSPLE